MITRTVIFAISLGILWTPRSVARTDQYVQSMKTSIDVLFNSEAHDQRLEAIRTFERIGQAESQEWLPFYYASLGYVMICSQLEDASQKDHYLDLGQNLLDKAHEIVAEESELSALQGFIYMMRVTIDPASRGQQFSGLSMQAFQQAIRYNPDNPRALYLMAQMSYGTAQFFNSETTEACGLLERSLEKFETVKNHDELAPNWGRDGAMAFKQQCLK